MSDDGLEIRVRMWTPVEQPAFVPFIAIVGGHRILITEHGYARVDGGDPGDECGPDETFDDEDDESER